MMYPTPITRPAPVLAMEKRRMTLAICRRCGHQSTYHEVVQTIQGVRVITVRYECQVCGKVTE